MRYLIFFLLSIQLREICCLVDHENIALSTANTLTNQEGNSHRSLFILDYSTAFSSTETNLNATNATDVPISVANDNNNNIISKEDFSPLSRRFKLNQKQTAYESSFVQLRGVNVNAAHLKGKTYVNSDWKKSVMAGQVSLTSIFHKALRSGFKDLPTEHDSTYSSLVEYVQNLIASGFVHTVVQYSSQAEQQKRISDTIAFVSANYSSLVTSVLVNMGTDMATSNHYVKSRLSGGALSGSMGEGGDGEYLDEEEDGVKEGGVSRSLASWYSTEKALASQFPPNLYNLIENSNADGLASTFLSGSFNCFQLVLDLSDISSNLLPLEFERFLGKALCRCQGTLLKKELPESNYFSYWDSLSSLVSNAIGTVTSSSGANTCNVTLDDGEKLFHEEMPYRLKSLYYIATRQSESESETDGSTLPMQGLLPLQSLLNSNLHISSQASVVSAVMDLLSKKLVSSQTQASEILSETYVSGSVLLHSGDTSHPILKRATSKVSSSSTSTSSSSSSTSYYSSSYSSSSSYSRYSSSRTVPSLSPTSAPTSNSSTSAPAHTSRYLSSRDYSLEESDVNRGAYTFSQWELTDTSENEFDLVAKTIDEEFARNSSLTSDLSM